MNRVLLELSQCLWRGMAGARNDRNRMIRKKSARKTWSDLTPKQRAAVLTLASIQISLAATAWTDLAFRSPDTVRGSKGKWAVIIAVNTVGPIIYFARGIRR